MSEVKEERDSREIRVFLSSTFRDMNPERDYLLTQVFPELRKKARERGVTLIEIDLRWGIREEDSHNGMTVELCLQEIDRCRKNPPFFIGFLGERYGWIPRKEELKEYWERRKDSPYAQTIELALEEGISVTELEMRHAFLGKEADPEHAKIFLRSRTLTDELCREGAPTDYIDSQHSSQLSELKGKLRQSPCLAMDGYESVEAFGEGVRLFLEGQLDRLYPRESTPDPEERRRQSQRTYARSRLQGYVPREDLREDVWRRLKGADEANTSLALWLEGESGIGKSALMADLEGWLPTEHDVKVVAYYLGADGDRSLDGWSAFLWKTLSPNPPPSSPQEQWEKLTQLFLEAQSREHKPLILLLDAVDQLPREDLGRLMELRFLLPRMTRLLVSAPPETLPEGGEKVEISGLTPERRRAAIELFLEGYQKKLEQGLLGKIVQDEATAVPLFLRLLLEELRLHGRFETLTVRAEELLKTRTAGKLFVSVLKTLDRDFARNGRELSTGFVTYLAVSWKGVGEEDLSYVLAGERDPVDPGTRRPRLPDAHLGALLGHLEPYCLRDGGRLVLLHAALKNELLQEVGEERPFRERLISHFEGSEAVEGVVERCYQRWKLKNTPSLIEDLREKDVIASFIDTEPRLLQTMLSDLGAGDNTVRPEIGELTHRWLQGEKSQENADWMNRVALWLMEKGFYRLAEPFFKESLTISRQSLPEGHPDIVASLNNLGSLFKAQGRLEEAEPLLRESREITHRNESQK